MHLSGRISKDTTTGGGKRIKNEKMDNTDVARSIVEDSEGGVDGYHEKETCGAGGNHVENGERRLRSWGQSETTLQVAGKEGLPRVWGREAKQNPGQQPPASREHWQ